MEEIALLMHSIIAWSFAVTFSVAINKLIVAQLKMKEVVKYENGIAFNFILATYPAC